MEKEPHEIDRPIQGSKMLSPEMMRKIRNSIPPIPDTNNPTPRIERSPEAQRLMLAKIAKSIPPLGSYKESPASSDTGIAHLSPPLGLTLPKQEEFELVKSLRDYVKTFKGKNYAETTLRDYERKAAKLNRSRPTPDSSPDVASLAGSKRSYYGYRAALIWDAIKRAQKALQQRDKATHGSTEHQDAIRALVLAKRDLDSYPPDPQQRRYIENAHKPGLDVPEQGEWTKAKAEGRTRKPVRADGKAKTASYLNKTIPDWRQCILQRLIDIDSNWQEWAAVCALTGCRPDELGGIRVCLLPDGKISFTIAGAKVSESKGQPERTLQLREECAEFHFLSKRLTAQGGRIILAVPISRNKNGDIIPIANPAAAFCAAMSRAGKQALGQKTQFSPYVWRHSIASDLKADGMDREDIAAVLGHAVTETASTYGRFSGGNQGARQIEAQASRSVKVNHRNFSGPAPAVKPENPPEAVPGELFPYPSNW